MRPYMARGGPSTIERTIEGKIGGQIGWHLGTSRKNDIEPALQRYRRRAIT
jgi:hypothetical protein